jgi:long-chain acyl-CoA synthetase
LLAGELAQLRPGRASPPLPWAPGVRIEEDLGADSLERLQLATALAEAVHLHGSGIDDSLLGERTVGEWVETVAEGQERYSAELTFRTSGSHGQPKWCVHELADLEAEVVESARLLAGTRRVVGTVPSHHIYGFLFTILLPAQLGCAFLDARAHSPAGLGASIQTGDAVVAYPDLWRAFVRTVSRTAPGAVAITSTAPCPPDVARGVRAAGLARFIEVYGSSETAGIGWRDEPQSAYELFGFWRRGADDRELIRMSAGSAERAYAVPDRLNWEGLRQVRPAGRAEDAVQVGGINVFPAVVCRVLTAHPGVAQAAVRLMRPDEGTRLKAFVVPQPDADRAALLADLWTYIEAHLTPPERPKSIVFGAELPVGALAKAADWPIAPVAEAGYTEPDGSFTPPQT